MNMDDLITEFTWLDTKALHLVGGGANGFSPLLAKAAEAVDSVLGEQHNVGPMGATVLTYDPSVTSQDGMVKFVSAATRDKMIANGVAMKNGDFPIADKGHLKSAIEHLGNYTGNMETDLRNYTGNRAAAKAHIIKRARELGLTSMLPKNWGVAKNVTKTTVGNDGTVVVTTASEHFDPGDGVVKVESLSDDPVEKTLVVPEVEIEKAKAKPVEEDNTEGDGDEDDAKKALTEALEIVTNADAAKSVSDFQSALSRATDLLSGLVVGTNNSQVATKEIEDMTNEELIKLLDERDAAKKAAKVAKKAAKVAAAPLEVEGTAEKAAEVAKSVDPETDKLVKTIAALEDRLAKMEDTPVGVRPFSNASGVDAGLTAPVQRGAEGAETVSAFKALEDKVANATTAHERQRYATELLLAKSMAAERIREASPSNSRGLIPLLAQPASALANAAADR